MVRTKPASERRSDLLDATERLLRDKGASAMTVEDITEGAGVSKGTFYLYFRAKEDVLAALRVRYVEALLERQARAVAKLHPADWLGRLETWLVAGIRDHLDNPQQHDTLFHLAQHGGTPALEDAVHDGDVHGPVYGHVDTLAAMLADGARAGAFALIDPEATAVVLYGAMHHAADYLHHAADDALTERVLSEIRRMCRRLVAAG